MYRTSVEGVYAVGDVIGFPALAATAMEQGRIAALSALGRPTEAMGELLPIGIYSIPEISFVGKTEEELTEAGVPYEVGISRYRELARGQILGDSHGMLKLLVSLDDRTLLGVHILGTGATELVHIGQVAMGAHATVDYLVGTVFNYPTLAEAYKVAALDAQNRLQSADRRRSAARVDLSDAPRRICRIRRRPPSRPRAAACPEPRRGGANIASWCCNVGGGGVKWCALGDQAPIRARSGEMCAPRRVRATAG